MEKQHLTYFKIENFKRFDSFEMSNLGQFNLIVGDNNVGKTSVLEALTLETDRINLVSKLIESFISRNDILHSQLNTIIDKNIIQKQFWANILKNTNKHLNLSYEFRNQDKKTASIEFIENNLLNAEDISSISKQAPVVKQPELWIRYYYNNQYKGTFGSYNSEYDEFFSSDDFFYDILNMNIEYNDNHINNYFKYINPYKDRRARLEDGLRFLLKNLEEVRPHKLLGKELLGVVLNDDEKIYPITQFGDGLTKIMRVILGIFSCQSGRIMIDEIDTGIHFSRIKGYWKTIIELCIAHDIQLFATTHSLECQRAFIEALEDEDMKQYQKGARNITLLENKQGEVKAFTYDFEQFEYSLSIGVNTRGGQL